MAAHTKQRTKRVSEMPEEQTYTISVTLKHMIQIKQRKITKRRFIIYLTTVIILSQICSLFFFFSLTNIQFAHCEWIFT